MYPQLLQVCLQAASPLGIANSILVPHMRQNASRVFSGFGGSLAEDALLSCCARVATLGLLYPTDPPRYTAEERRRADDDSDPLCAALPRTPAERSSKPCGVSGASRVVLQCQICAPTLQLRGHLISTNKGCASECKTRHQVTRFDVRSSSLSGAVPGCCLTDAISERKFRLAQ